MLATWAAFAIFGSIALYIAVSLSDARKLDGARGFLHNVGPFWRAIISLTAFSVTLGTGLVYILSQATTTGWLIFLTPLGVFLGYASIAYYYRGLGYRASSDAPNFFYLLSEKTADNAVSLTHFGRFFGIFMALTYVLVLAFELQVGSKVIIDSLLNKPTSAAYLGFSVFILLIVFIYTALGGLRAAVSTDVWQMALIALFLGVLWIIVAEGDRSFVPAPISSSLRDGLAVGSAILALIMAITTQFYSIINVSLGSNYEPKKQWQIFLVVGFLSGSIYFGVAYFALSLGSPIQLTELVRGIVNHSSDIDFVNGALVAALFGGMMAVLLSTIDNMMLSVTQVTAENAFGINPFRDGHEKSVADLKAMRWAHAAVFLFVLVLVVGLWMLPIDPFPLLLTILFAATIMSPLVSASAWVNSHGKKSMFVRPIVAWVIFLLTVMAWFVYFVLTIKGLREESVWLHLGAFFVALALAIYDLLTAKAATKVPR